MICSVWIIPKIGSSIGNCLKLLVTPGYLHFHGLDASDKSKDGCVFAKLHLPRLQNHGHLYITFSNMTKMLSQFIFTGKALRSKILNLRQQVHICWAASCLKIPRNAHPTIPHGGSMPLVSKISISKLRPKMVKLKFIERLQSLADHKNR